MPQETQPELVEAEIYGIQVESRALPAGWMEHLLMPMLIRPKKNIV
jgi:hypothetical protein